jgi:hypothetical protein
MFDLGFATGEFFRSGETDSGYQPLATRVHQNANDLLTLLAKCV